MHLKWTLALSKRTSLLTLDFYVSMGGAVVSEAASRGVIPNLIGVAVLDIVEGMERILTF